MDCGVACAVSFVLCAWDIVWALSGLLVVTALGVMAWPLGMLMEADWAQEIDVETVLYLAAAIVIIAVLLLPESGAWYRRVREPANAGV